MKRYIRAASAGNARKEMIILQKALQTAFDAIDSCDATIYDMFKLASLQDSLDISIRELADAIESQEE